MSIRTRLAALLLGLGLLAAPLCGCEAVILQEMPGELPQSTATPPPIGQDEAVAFTAQLYFKTEDGLKLAAEQRELLQQPGQSYAWALCEALTAGPQSTSLVPAIPAGLSLSHIEQSAQVCSVYFTGTPPGNEQELLAARAALAATLAQEGKTEYVQLFVNNVQPGYNGRPIGVMAPIEVSLDAYLTNTVREFDSVAASNTGSEAPPYDSPYAALYFTDTSRSLLVAQVRQLNYLRSSSLVDVLRTLLDEMVKGPVGGDGLESVLPADMRLHASDGAAITLQSLRDPFARATELLPEEAPLDDLPRMDDSLWRAPEDEDVIVELRFRAPAGEYDEDLVYGALVYAVTGLCPHAAGVRIYLDDVPVLPHNHAVLDYFTRADFAHLVGDMVTLVFPESDGSGLRAVTRCLPQEMANDALERVRALFTGSADPGVPYPAMFTPEDLLSVTLREDMAVVNWRAGFHEKLKDMLNKPGSALPATAREQMLIFGIVNTLTLLPGVERVWMLEDGARILNTAGLIYLGNPLMRSPGLMLE